MNPRTLSCLRTFTSFFVQLFSPYSPPFPVTVTPFSLFCYVLLPIVYSSPFTTHCFNPLFPFLLFTTPFFTATTSVFVALSQRYISLRYLFFLCYLSCNTQHEYIYLIYSGHMLYSRERSTYIPSHTSNHAMSDVRSPVNYFRSGVQFLFKFKV